MAAWGVCSRRRDCGRACSPTCGGCRTPPPSRGSTGPIWKPGARLITTNTFGTSAPKLAPYGVTVDEVMAAAVANVRQAMQQAGVEDAYVCADLGPSGKLLRPYGDLDFEDAVTLFAETVRGRGQGRGGLHPHRDHERPVRDEGRRAGREGKLRPADLSQPHL